MAQGNFTADFSALLRSIRRPSRKEIAFELGIPYSTYDNYLRGLQAFPPDKLFRLYEITGDVRILHFVFRKEAGLVNNPKSIRHLELLLSIDIGKVQELIEAALEDGILEKSEYRLIRKKIIELSRLCESLDDSLRLKLGEA